MKRNGFTIIEMLVVVIVIAILSGLVFKMIGAGGASSDNAKARRMVEALANACEEYRAEYGCYPPVPIAWDKKNGEWCQPVTYSYPATGGGKWSAGDDGSIAATLRNIPRSEVEKHKNYVFQFGVLSFLLPRIQNHAETAPLEFFEGDYDKSKVKSSDEHCWFSQNSAKNKTSAEIKKLKDKGTISRSSEWNADKHCRAVDNPRDFRFANKVAPLLTKDILKENDPDAQMHLGNVWTNMLSWIPDPWDKNLHYKSDPPYETYRIWSSGRDKTSGTADDIVAGSEN